MSNRVTVGTVLSVTLDGNIFFPTADSDLTDGKPKYENSVEMSSGRAFRKMVRQDQSISGLTLKVTSDELELLKGLNDRIEPFPMSYKNAAEDVYKGSGWIKLDTRKSQSGNAGVELLPDEKGWTLFN